MHITLALKYVNVQLSRKRKMTHLYVKAACCQSITQASQYPIIIISQKSNIRDLENCNACNVYSYAARNLAGFSATQCSNKDCKQWKTRQKQCRIGVSQVGLFVSENDSGLFIVLVSHCPSVCCQWLACGRQLTVTQTHNTLAVA